MITISSFLVEHDLKLKSTKNLLVRDLDEIEKNKFVAYIDENDESYDVMVQFDSKKNIIETACDCPANGVCNHIVALVSSLSTKNTKEKSIPKSGLKKIAKNKLSETDQILGEIDNIDLRDWISETLNKNKELAFHFKTRFGATNMTIDSDYIKKVVKECIFSVIGKRRTIQTNEVKKIVDTLNIALKPILDFIFSKTSETNYLLFTTLVNELNGFYDDYYITSTRISTLVKNLSDSLLKSLFNIKDFEEWQKRANFYISLIFKKKFYPRELEFCDQVYEYSKTNSSQNQYIINIIDEKSSNLIEDLSNKNLILNFELESFIFKVITENNLFIKHAHWFKPRRFENSYNLSLLKELLKINQNELAEKICLEQIAGNYNSEFDIPYVKILITIYKQNQDNIKLANVLSEYGKYIYSIEDYLFIKEHLPIEKFKKYRIAVLKNANYSLHQGNIDAFDFYYEVKKLDGKPGEIFNILQYCNNLEIINRYKEIALKIDKVKFLQAILNYSSYYEENDETINSISEYVVKSIRKNDLEFYLKNIPNYFRNSISESIKQKLKQL